MARSTDQAASRVNGSDGNSGKGTIGDLTVRIAIALAMARLAHGAGRGHPPWRARPNSAPNVASETWKACAGEVSLLNPSVLTPRSADRGARRSPPFASVDRHAGS